MSTQETTRALEQKIYHLCSMMAKGYNNYQMFDDLLQEGLLACYEVLHRYDPDKYDNPEQFFWLRARRGMSDYYMRRSKLVVPPKGYKSDKGGTPTEKGMIGSRLSYVDADDCHGKDELSVGDKQRTNLEDKDHKHWLTAKLFSAMDEREKEVINLRYFTDPLRVVSSYDVGKQMSPPVSETVVRRIEAKVMEKFK